MLCKKAYKELFGKDTELKFNIEYSRRFSPYNAKIIHYKDKITFKLSFNWIDVDDDIKLGLLQDLLRKLYKSKRTAENIKLYHNFIKSLDKYDKGSYEDEILLNSFNRVNKKYFDNKLMMPHLKWSNLNMTRLGSYNFHTNTLRISLIFKENQDLLDYVMYHELLHKELKFKESGNKTYFHTRQFRKLERSFSEEDYEKKLVEFIKRYKISIKNKSKKNLNRNKIKNSKSLLNFFR